MFHLDGDGLEFSLLPVNGSSFSYGMSWAFNIEKRCTLELCNRSPGWFLVVYTPVRFNQHVDITWHEFIWKDVILFSSIFYLSSTINEHGLYYGFAVIPGLRCKCFNNSFKFNIFPYSVKTNSWFSKQRRTFLNKQIHNLRVCPKSPVVKYRITVLVIRRFPQTKLDQRWSHSNLLTTRNPSVHSTRT